jgi:lysophospholipase L1-like esterase
MVDVVMKKLFKFFGLTATIIYVLATMPFVMLALQSEYYRFITLEQVSWKVAKLRPPKLVFAGDSITAGGRNWGLQLHLSPLAAINLGESGYLTSQIGFQVVRASNLGPEYVVVLAGTNDILGEDFDIDRFKRDYSAIFKTVQTFPDITYLITSIPSLRDCQFKEQIYVANRFLEEETAQYSNANFLDLAKALDSSGLPPEKLYSDNVHLDRSAYQIWADLIRGNLPTL